MAEFHTFHFLLTDVSIIKKVEKDINDFLKRYDGKLFGINDVVFNEAGLLFSILIDERQNAPFCRPWRIALFLDYFTMDEFIKGKDPVDLKIELHSYETKKRVGEPVFGPASFNHPPQRTELYIVWYRI